MKMIPFLSLRCAISRIMTKVTFSYNMVSALCTNHKNKMTFGEWEQKPNCLLVSGFKEA